MNVANTHTLPKTNIVPGYAWHQVGTWGMQCGIRHHHHSLYIASFFNLQLTFNLHWVLCTSIFYRRDTYLIGVFKCVKSIRMNLQLDWKLCCLFAINGPSHATRIAHCQMLISMGMLWAYITCLHTKFPIMRMLKHQCQAWIRCPFTLMRVKCSPLEIYP